MNPRSVCKSDSDQEPEILLLSQQEKPRSMGSHCSQNSQSQAPDASTKKMSASSFKGIFKAPPIPDKDRCNFQQG